MDLCIEYFGVLTGILYVWLVARQSIWCWLVSFLNLTAYSYIFFQSGLYADAALQGVYFVLTVYGWINWSRKKQELQVKTLSTEGLLYALMAVICGWCVIAVPLIIFKGFGLTWLDSHATAVSLVAQVLTAKKYIENWFAWIWANVAFCVLYYFKGLYPTLGLYLLFIALAVFGYLRWKESLKSQSSAVDKGFL